MQSERSQTWPFTFALASETHSFMKENTNHNGLHKGDFIMSIIATLGLLVIGMNTIEEIERTKRLQKEANMYSCDIVDAKTGKVYTPNV